MVIDKKNKKSKTQRSKIKMTNQKLKFPRGVKESLPSRLKSPTISKHKIMDDQTFPYHCESRFIGTKQSLWGQGIATHFLEKCWENENDKTE